MNFEKSRECNCDKVKHNKTRLKRKKFKMNFEKLREYNCDKVNYDKTLLKYSNSCISTKEIQNEL